MAKDAALKDASKTELADAYSKLKSRTKSAQVQAKKEGEALIEDVLTVASGGLVGYMMGQRYAQAQKDGEDAEGIAEAGQVGGFDLDLLVGGAATAAGMMKLGGKMSNTVRKIGIGGLTAYAVRRGTAMGAESVNEADA